MTATSGAPGHVGLPPPVSSQLAVIGVLYLMARQLPGACAPFGMESLYLGIRLMLRWESLTNALLSCSSIIYLTLRVEEYTPVRRTVTRIRVIIPVLHLPCSVIELRPGQHLKLPDLRHVSLYDLCSTFDIIDASVIV